MKLKNIQNHGLHLGNLLKKRAKTVPSAKKVMATVFRDAIIFIDCLQKGKTITGPYYASLVDHLNEKNKRKITSFDKKVLFLTKRMPIA